MRSYTSWWENWDVMDKLVTDRTEADVLYAKAIRKKMLNGTATQAEVDEWFAGLKGAYNYTDWNRLHYATEYLYYMLEENGINNLIGHLLANDIQPNTLLYSTELIWMLGYIRTIRQAINVKPTTPPLPATMSGMTFEKANDLEKILRDVYDLLTQKKYVEKQCGSPFVICGL